MKEKNLICKILNIYARSSALTMLVFWILLLNLLNIHVTNPGESLTSQKHPAKPTPPGQTNHIPASTSPAVVANPTEGKSNLHEQPASKKIISENFT